jgi:VanZ family protein
MPAVYAGRERRRAAPSLLMASLAVTVLAAIVFATLCPIGLRPHLGGANEERFGAYFLLGVMAALAAPRRPAAAAIIVVLAAVGLEYAQQLAPSRHAHVADAAVKALGGIVGVLSGQLAFPARRLLLGARSDAAAAEISSPGY